MIKVLCLVSVLTGAFGGQIGRVMTLSRVRMPTAFRPGASLGRPWGHQPQRLMQSASNRAPYVLYRSPSGHRYVRPYMTGTRGGYANGPWRTTATARVPSASPVTPEYEFVRAASATPILLHSHGGTGAIHTIPAPNLSLSEKPIVVVDGTEGSLSYAAIKHDMYKPSYQVTEKLPEKPFQFPKNIIEVPDIGGISKATTLTSSELNALMKNGALQLAAEYGVPPAIAVPQSSPLLPQQFTMQGFNTLLQDPLHVSADTSLLSPNIMFQPDQLFLQKLQNQLYQRYPGVEFVPYPVEMEPSPQLHVVSPETKKDPIDHKNVIRETVENTVVTLVPQVLNVTENVPEVTTVTEPQNVTLEIVTTETEAPTTTVKYILETTTEEDKTTPIYYAQVGQNVENAIANGIYSAINEVRAAAALAQVEKSQDKVEENITTTTTTIHPDLKTYFVQSQTSDEPNQTVTELKPLLGVPFSKVEPVNITFTVVRSEDTKPKVTKDGSVYAGQIVEATITEDQDYHKDKVNIHTRRPPLRLFAVNERKETTSVAPKLTVVKAKIPPKSKLTFDDKTGEPILRIYASYVDSPLQKELITSKLSNIKHVKEVLARKQDGADRWKSATVKNLDKHQSGSDVNQVTEFGLKLRPRMDEYPALFEDYE